MKDSYGREIDYLRISVTDKCNLNCLYCRPEKELCQQKEPCSQKEEMLTFDELMQIVRAAASLGITKIKITGGEPFLRKDVVSFVSDLKKEKGISSVTLTTNGTLAAPFITELAAVGLDGMNISLDSMEENRFRRLTGAGSDSWKQVQNVIRESVHSGIRTKINCVVTGDNKDEILQLVELAANENIIIRFIELMSLGQGCRLEKVYAEEILQIIKKKYPDLVATCVSYGNGPARYYKTRGLQGKIGIISANSSNFCSHCSRIRLTAEGKMLPCLCSHNSYDIKKLIRSSSSSDQLRDFIAGVILEKPAAHLWDRNDLQETTVKMSRIGG